jgi:hypothetical protein
MGCCGFKLPIMAGPAQIDAKTTALRDLYGENDAARRILDDFSRRQRKQWITKLDQLLKRLSDEVSRPQAIQVLRRLEEFGCGEFIEGRKGYPTRFAWDDDLRAVGQVASGQSATIPTIEDEDEEDAENYLGAKSAPDAKHSYRLRSDYVVSIHLPTDLTEKEAQRLSDFMKTLPL